MVQRETAPNEVTDIEKFIQEGYTLEYALLGTNENLIGVVGQADFDFLNDEPIEAGGEERISLRAPGGDSVNGQVVSSGQFSASVEWLDTNGAVVRREGIFSNRDGGAWANYKLEPKGPFVDVVIENDTNSQQTVSMMGHYR